MVMKWMRSLLSTPKKLIGRDPFGNSYYEIVKQSGRIQRSCEGENSPRPEEYTPGDIPHEWEAWLRGKRSDPPTNEELEKNFIYKKTVQARGAKKKEEDDVNQEKAYADGLIQREVSSHLPSVSGKVKPQPGTDGKFEPEAWTPGNSEQK